MVMICDSGNELTALDGTTTGDLQLLGTATVAGTKTKLLNGTDTTAELGTV